MLSITEAVVVQCKRKMVRGSYVTRATVRDASGPVTCLWQGATQYAAIKVGQYYKFSGVLQTIDHKRVLVGPRYRAVQPPTATPAPPQATGFTARRLGKTARTGLASVSIFALLSIAASSGDNSLPVEASSSVAAVAAVSHVTKPVSLDVPAPAPVSKVVNPTPKVATSSNGCDIIVIPFAISIKNDPTLPKGRVKLAHAGLDGQDKVCHPQGHAHKAVTTHIVPPVSQAMLVGNAAHSE